MSKKTSKIITQKAKTPKGKTSASAIVGITLCTLVLAGLGFAVAELNGLTGTRFLFKREIILRGQEHLAIPEQVLEKSTSPKKNKKKKKESPEGKDAQDESQKRTEKSPKNGKVTLSAKTKNGTSEKIKLPVEPLPLAAFTFIAQRPQTWPAFIRLTRTRNIAVVDPQTGISMGRMDIPAGTIVKIQKVNTNGSLNVFDRTGQTFQVEASGTNFSAAFAAAKNKPKKKAPKKKVVVAASPPAKVQAPPVVQKINTPIVKKSGAPILTAFGTTIEESEWDEAEAEEEEED